jgi:hypothetical protein
LSFFKQNLQKMLKNRGKSSFLGFEEALRSPLACFSGFLYNSRAFKVLSIL